VVYLWGVEKRIEKLDVGGWLFMGVLCLFVYVFERAFLYFVLCINDDLRPHM
jgi:hypothetical protein